MRRRKDNCWSLVTQGISTVYVRAGADCLEVPAMERRRVRRVPETMETIRVRQGKYVYSSDLALNHTNSQYSGSFIKYTCVQSCMHHYLNSTRS